MVSKGGSRPMCSMSGFSTGGSLGDVRAVCRCPRVAQGDGRSGVKLGTKRSISAKLDAMTEVALHGVQGWVQANVFHEWVFHRW